MKRFLLFASSLLPIMAQALPFVPTTDPNLTTTHWYQIKTGNVYFYSDANNFGDVNASSSASAANEYLWCFVGDETTGYKIYNRGAKGYMVDSRVIDDATDPGVDYYEAGSGNNFYITYQWKYGRDTYKMYVCYDYENGVYGSQDRYNSYTVVEFVEAPMIETPYQSLNPYYFDIPHNAQYNIGDEGYAMLFDKNRSTKWCVINNSGAWETATLEFMSDVPFIPDAYYLTTALDTKAYPNRNPKAWKLFGKAKLTDEWTLLANVTDGAGAGLGTENCTDYRFGIAGCNEPYQFFRFEVSQIRGKNASNNTYTMQLAELQLTGEAVKQPTKGDVDGEGSVDIDDLNIIINMMLGKASKTAAADLTGDGNVDVDDVNMILNIILGFDTPGKVETYTANGVQFKMVQVEGGVFMMGDKSTKSQYADQRPAHLVMVDSYSIGQTEVTQELWHAVMGDYYSQFYYASQYGYDDNPQRPAEFTLSWDRCQEFIEKLNQLTGQNFRLPTEAEWEFAARGGNLSKGYVYAGSNNLDEVAWYRDNCESQSHPVATKAPNELGLYDMSGNVSEWCQDWYGPYTIDPQVNPTGPDSGEYRVVRGLPLNWNNAPLTYRFYNYPDSGSSTTGLRLAK